MVSAQSKKFYLVLQSVQELERRRHVELERAPTKTQQFAAVNFGRFTLATGHRRFPTNSIAEGRFGVSPGENTDTGAHGDGNRNIQGGRVKFRGRKTILPYSSGSKEIELGANAA